MKKFLLLSLILVTAVAGYSQLEVKPGSFKEVLGFVNINTNIYEDSNNVLYAVIKVNTENINDAQRHQLLFKGNESTFIELEYKVGEVWVYLSSKPATYLKISHPDFGETEFWFPYDLAPKRGYEMVLVNNSSSTPTGYGSLTVKTKPENGAVVKLNGKEINKTTPYSNDMIATGQYEIIVSKDRYKTTAKTVDIQNGDDKTVEIEMPLDVADITINADEETEVSIDGTFMKKGTWKGELNSGLHFVSLKKQYHKTLTETINVVSETPKTYTFDLKPLRGTISITSEPSGATVFIDDKNYGVTPIEISDLDLGKDYELKLLKNGKAPQKKHFTLHDENTVAINEKLMDFPYDAIINAPYSVSETKKVFFSKGNLQYRASTKTWRFAEHQWDLVGEESNKNISNTYSGWIDLFGYGTGNDPTKHLEYNNDYTDYYEWGDNPIENGGNKAGIWYTLKREEWSYIINYRKTKSGIRFAKATVNNMAGVILLPDSWNKKTYKLKKPNEKEVEYKVNNISSNDWNTYFATNGAVFLPAAGTRVGQKLKGLGSYGAYWTSSLDCSMTMQSRILYFDKSYLSAAEYSGRGTGVSVRLVITDE